jgi:hypothetical protein
MRGRPLGDVLLLDDPWSHHNIVTAKHPGRKRGPCWRSAVAGRQLYEIENSAVRSVHVVVVGRRSHSRGEEQPVATRKRVVLLNRSSGVTRSASYYSASDGRSRGTVGSATRAFVDLGR